MAVTEIKLTTITEDMEAMGTILLTPITEITETVMGMAMTISMDMVEGMVSNVIPSLYNKVLY